MQAYSSIFSIFTRIETLLRHIQAFSCIFSTLCNPCIFRTGGIFKLWNFDQTFSEPCHRAVYSGITKPYSEPCVTVAQKKPGIKPSIIASQHIRNPVIFTKIGKPCVTLEIQPWHIDNLGIFTNLTYLKPDTNSESSQRFKICKSS